MDKETEQSNLRNISDWQRERQGRVDAYAAVLAHLNAAAAAVPGGDVTTESFVLGLAHWAGNARGALRRVLDETNPFVS
jgi:hypothetical protein